MYAGAGNGSTATPFRPPCMAAVQIRAGKDPPVTVASPPTPSREVRLPEESGRNRSTAVARWGT